MSQEESKTICCYNLSERVSEEILYELFLQAGPIRKVVVLKDPGKEMLHGFVTYTHASSIPYALKLFRGTELFRKHLVMRLKKSVPKKNTKYEKSSDTKTSTGRYWMDTSQNCQSSETTSILSLELAIQKYLKFNDAEEAHSSRS